MLLKINMIISIIIPVYNVELYIEECLSSILNQEFKDLELLLINDGSTDSSLEICKRISLANSNVKLFSQKNNGTASARNKGINNANGDYIWFIDSDDIIRGDSLTLISDILKKTNRDLLFFNMSTFNVDNELKIEPNLKRNLIVKDTLIGENNISQFFNSSVCRYIYKRDFIIKNNLVFDINQYYEDAYFNIKVFNKIKNILKIEETLYYYRIRINSKTTKAFSIDNCYIKIESFLSLIQLCEKPSDLVYFKNKVYGYEEIILDLLNIYLKQNDGNSLRFYTLLKEMRPKLNYKNKKHKQKAFIVLYNINLKAYFYIVSFINKYKIFL
tara:strand:- start:969 stop:1955 length:987 start_codon:yes stop_codon:yes gene_type:complete